MGQLQTIEKIITPEKKYWRLGVDPLYYGQTCRPCIYIDRNQDQFTVVSILKTQNTETKPAASFAEAHQVWEKEIESFYFPPNLRSGKE